MWQRTAKATSHPRIARTNLPTVAPPHHSLDHALEARLEWVSSWQVIDKEQKCLRNKPNRTTDKSEYQINEGLGTTPRIWAHHLMKFDQLLVHAGTHGPSEGGKEISLHALTMRYPQSRGVR